MGWPRHPCILFVVLSRSDLGEFVCVHFLQDCAGDRLWDKKKDFRFDIRSDA